MPRLKLFIVLAAAGFIILGFQNCSAPRSISGAESIIQGGSGFITMENVAAQATIGAYEGICAATEAASATSPLIAPGDTVDIDPTVPFARATHVSLIQGGGNLTIYGVSSDALVETISSITGNVSLCGADLQSITGSSVGNVIVENGNVDAISGFSGNLVIFSGDFPSKISNFDGNIIVKTATGEVKGRSYHVK